MRSSHLAASVSLGLIAIAGAALHLFRESRPAVAQLASPVLSKRPPSPAPTPVPAQGGRTVSTESFSASDASLQRIPREFADELARALTESDPEQRDSILSAALTTWARNDLGSASRWAESQAIFPKSKAIAAVVNGAAAANAEAAIQFVERIANTDTDNQAEYGTDLIVALNNAGKPALAARWAEENKVLNIDWLTGAFERWGATESEAALLHAIAVDDPVRRRAAVDAAISGWSKTEPKSLADYASNFPAGPEKNLAVVTALRAWAENDPQATADWMLAHRSAIASVPNLKTVTEE